MFSLSYELTGAGWADATVSDGENQVWMIVSYLHDSLLDLANAALAIKNGANEAVAILLDEPGEHRLLFTALDEHQVKLVIRWYEDFASWQLCDEDDYKIVFEASTQRQHVVTAISGALRTILEVHGEVGYKQKWIEHEFPIAEYRKLVEDGMVVG